MSNLSESRGSERRDFHIGPFLVDARGMRVLKGSERLAADAQQCEILVTLANAYPSIVSKLKLIEAVWGGQYVTDAALHKSVSSLRGLFRSHGADVDVIETRHRRGYQLALEPRWVPDRATVYAAPDDDADLPRDAVVEPEASTSIPSDTPSSPENPRRRSARKWAWLAAPVLALGVFALAEWRNVPAPPPATAMPDPESPKPGPEQDEFAGSDFDGLVMRFKQAVASQPDLARRLVQVMHLRATRDNDRLKLGLALKYEGVLAYYSGQIAEANRAYTSSLRYLDSDEAQRERANVLNNLGVLLVDVGQDLTRTEAIVKEALSIRKRIDDRAGQMGSHTNYANLLIRQRRWDEAKAQAAAGMALALELKSIDQQIDLTLIQADIARDSTAEDPMPAYESALTLARSLGSSSSSAATIYQRMAQIYQRRNQLERAGEYVDKAIDAYRASGQSTQLPALLFTRGGIEQAQGRAREAAATYQEVIDQAEPGTSAVRISSLIALAQVQREAKSPDWQGLIKMAEQESIVLNDPIALSDSYAQRVRLLLEEGDAVTAKHVLGQAREALADKGDWERIQNLRMLAVLVDMAGGQANSAQDEVRSMREEANERGDIAWIVTLETLAMMTSAAAGNVADSIREFNTSGRSQGWWLRSGSRVLALDQPVAPIPAKESWLEFMLGAVSGMTLWGLISIAIRRRKGRETPVQELPDASAAQVESKP